MANDTNKRNVSEEAFSDFSEATGIEASSMKTPFSEINALRAIQNPIPRNWIKDKKGFSYIPQDAVVRILNKAFRGRWSFEVKEHVVFKAQPKKVRNSDKVIEQGYIIQVLGKMTVPGWGIREQWGAQILLGGSDVQEHAYKGATTDAMKKCASMFGIALELYGQTGMYELAIGPDDFLMEDESYFEKMKEQIKQAQGTPTANAEPDMEAITADELSEQQEMENAGQETPAAPTEPVVQSTPQEQAPAPAQKESTPAPTPVAEAPEEKAVPWQNEDILEMKNIMNQMGMSNNKELNPYVQKFMRSEEANIQDHIRPNNVKDFIIYMQNTIRNGQAQAQS